MENRLIFFHANSDGGSDSDRDTGLGLTPDLVPIDLAVDLTECSEAMVLDFRIRNEGGSAVPAGVVIAVYVDDAGTPALVARVTTTRALLPGEEAFTIPHDLDGLDPTADVTFRVVANEDGDDELADVVECRLENNEAEVTASCGVII